MTTITTITTATHKRHSPPPPLPSGRSSRFSFHISGILPTPDLVSSIPSGAHYVGAPPVTHRGADLRVRHRRSSSRGIEDLALVESVYKDALDDLEEMYCGRATWELIKQRWTPDAEFEDPWCACKGLDQCAAQWLTLPHSVAASERTSTRILAANLDPNRLVYAQTQEYTLRWFGIKRVINSIVVVDFDEEFKIVRLLDQWNGEQLPTRWGSLYLRKLRAKFLTWFAHIPRTEAP